MFANSNQLVGFQAVNKSKLGMAPYPTGGQGAKPGQYLKPSMLWSISARAKHPEAAVKVVNFFVANPDAGVLLGVERGVPASAKVRTAVEATLDELGKEMAQYIAFISDKVGDLPAPPPQGAGEIQVRAAPHQRAGRLRPPLGCRGRQAVRHRGERHPRARLAERHAARRPPAGGPLAKGLGSRTSAMAITLAMDHPAPAQKAARSRFRSTGFHGYLFLAALARSASSA